MKPDSKKAWAFIALALLASPGFAATNVSLNYVWNGTSWIPWLATSDGKPYIDMNLFNVTAGAGTFRTNLTVSNNILFVSNLTGRVGIGTTNPLSTLHVVGDINVTGASYLGASTIQAGNITTTDRLGIGTSSPNQQLHVIGNANITGTVWGNGISLIPTNVSILYGNNGTASVPLLTTGTGILRMRAEQGLAETTNTLLTGGNATDLRVNASTASGIPLSVVGFASQLANLTEWRSSSGTVLASVNATGSWRLGSAATPVLFIDNNTGRVGIGTANPSNLLYVRQDTDGEVSLASFANLINGGTNDVATIQLDLGDGSSRGGLKIQAGKEQDFSTGANRDAFAAFTLLENDAWSEKVRITSAGYVGIGTTGPQTTLHVLRQSGSSGNLILEGNSSLTGAPKLHLVDANTAGVTAAPAWTLQNSGDQFGLLRGSNISGTSSTFVTVTNAGNVGINTTSPAALLEIKGTTSEVLILNSSSSSGTQLKLRNTDTGGREWLLISAGSGNAEGAGNFSIMDNTAGQRRLTILGNGYVGINTTTPNNILQAVGVNRSIKMSSVSALAGADVVGLEVQNTGIYTWGIGLDGSVNSGQSLVFRTSGMVGGTNRMTIDTAGNVGINTTSPKALLDVSITGSHGNATWIGRSESGQFGMMIGTSPASARPYIQGWRTDTSTTHLMLNPYGGGVGIGYDNTDTGYALVVNGNVGINTISPNSTLHILGTGTGGGLRVTNQSNGAEVFFVNSTKGMVGIGTTGPNATLELDQGGADGPILKLVSTDIAHGMTDVAETDVFGYLQKIGATSGGLVISGLNDDARQGILLNSYIGFDTTTPGNSAVEARVYRTSGTGTTSPAANQNLFAVFDGSAGVVKFVVDQEGDTYQVGGATFNGSVGIGTTSPQALLHIQGTGNPGIRLMGSPGSNYSDIHTDSSGNLYLRADQGNTGANSNITFNIDGSEKARIDSSGNVGIGTAAPSYNLVVRSTGGQLAIEDSASSGAGWIFNASGGNPGVLTIDPISSVTRRIAFVNSGSGGTPNVGIGTTAPAGTLHINSSLGAGALRVENTTGASLLFVNGTTGNVGIGTTGPSSVLDINSSSHTILNIDRQSTSLDGLVRLKTGSTNIWGIGMWNTLASNDFAILDIPQATARLVIDNETGNVGIGTTTPASKLHVNLDAAAAGGITIREGATTVLNLEDASTSGTNGILDLNSGGTTNVRMYAFSGSPSWINAGNVGIGTTAPSSKLEVNGTGDVLKVNGTSLLAISGGNVGIGTTGPLAGLQVNGGDMIIGAKTSSTGAFPINGIRMMYGAGTGQTAIVGELLTAAGGRQAGSAIVLEGVGNVGGWQAGKILFQTANTDDTAVGQSLRNRTVINEAGFVGINTTTPSGILHVQTNGEATLLVSNAKVGIGTTAPNYKLHVAGGVNASSYATNGTDYAEWMEKLRPGEKLEGGDIVAVVNGKVTKSFNGNAALYMVITDSAGVIGNEGCSGCVPVSFVGKVRTKVAGRVNEGDYILADGSARPKSAVTFEEFKQKVVGIALEGRGEGTARILVAVGVK